MNTRVSTDLSASAAEDPLQQRFVRRNKSNASAAAGVHQRAFNYPRRPASYTFHSVGHPTPHSIVPLSQPLRAGSDPRETRTHDQYVEMLHLPA